MASNRDLLKRWNEHCAMVRASTSITFDESIAEKTVRIEHLKKDVKAMVEYYFPHYATAECAPFHIKFANAVKKNKRFKGHAEWGRGLAKSVWLDVIIPFWLWMNDEAHYVVVIGKNETAAAELLMDLQAEFESNMKIKSDFGDQKIVGSWEDGNFRTKSGFIGKSLGMGQSVRGLRVGSQRPDLCIWDDLDDRSLTKNPKRQREVADWIDRAVLGTMDGSIRRGMGANNKFAPNMIHDILRERHPNWFWHTVNAYNPVDYSPTWSTKYPPNYYREIEEDMGRLAALAEYNNTPHTEGTIFKEEQISWGKMPQIRSMKAIVGHWDIAYAGTATADFNAVKVWGYHDELYWYIEGFVKQTKMRAAVQYMCNVQKRFKDIHVYWQFESQFWNDEVQRTIREVERQEGISLNLVKIDIPKGHKYDRILTLQPYYQNNRIRYNDKMKADNDTQVGIAHLMGIEPGYKTPDDSPDADQQAISRLSAMYKQANNTVILGKRKNKFRY